jgi:hypothetical protein
MNNEDEDNWQEVEMRRQTALDKAVQAADRIICDAGSGDNDELMLLTALVAKRFVEKTECMISGNIVRKQFMQRAGLSEPG